ncbi:MAG: hypothetical protein MUF54_19680 [Polyangiaceae bacterium]|nr:hypothetical protein [Polyangiaceae bacterium]
MTSKLSPVPGEKDSTSNSRLPFERAGRYRIVKLLPRRVGAPLEALAVQEGPHGFRRACTLHVVRAPAQLDEDPIADDMVREAMMLGRLRHSGILSALDFFEHEGWLVLARPFEGTFTLAHITTTLSRRLQRIDDVIVWYVVHALFDALAHAHTPRFEDESPTVHGDLRPQNLLLRSDGSMLVRGFRGVEGAPRGDEARSLLPYASPEQLSGHEPTPRSDLFCAARIAWELLAVPTATERARRGLGSGATKEPGVLSVATIRPDVQPAVAAALDICLSPDPDARTTIAAWVATSIRRSVDVLAGKELLARLHAGVYRRLHKRSPRWGGACSEPGLIDSSAPTLRLQRDASRAHSTALRVLHPEHPLYATQPVDRIAHADDREHASGWPDGSAAVVPCDNLSSDAEGHEHNEPAVLGWQGRRAGLSVMDDWAQPEETPTVPDRSAIQPPWPDGYADDPDTLLMDRRPRPIQSEPADAERAPRTPRRDWTVSDDSRRLPTQPAMGAQPPVVGGPSHAVPLSFPPTAYATERPAPTALVFGRTRTRAVMVAVAAGITVLGVFALHVVPYASHPTSTLATAPGEASMRSPHALRARVNALGGSTRSAVEGAVGTSRQPREKPSPAPAVHSAVQQSPILTARSRLTFRGPPEGTVFVNGVPVGKTGQPHDVPCGWRFVRVGTEPVRGDVRTVRWLSEGQSVMLPCEEAILRDATPLR